ncbi:hypothetical protein [Rhodococcus sp. D-1]|uniref:hypothetical protein n=1 Tax=Rhodococcus sp. D-1 TaxID=1912238 RepID=UPI0009776A15|nr:hypothetical protein [Rhodococcus sp. D-1]OMQ25318.1 hypothetical protein BK799_31065 [Rhodococcus sp. D-1]
MDLTDPEYALKWPREVFIAEATEMMRADRDRHSFTADYAFLLQEAFVGSAPADEYVSIKGMAEWTSEPAAAWGKSIQQIQTITNNVPVVSELLRRANELQTAATRRPYFSRRNAVEIHERPSGQPEWSTAKSRFSTFTARWQASGYFGETYPNGCVDVPDDLEENLAEKLAKLYGRTPPSLTHGEPDGWSDDEFCDLIELLHDLAARPRNRIHHDYSQCGHHYSDHSVRTGQMLYRILVNELLAATNLPVRLATDGEDRGRLITTTDDARTELLQLVVQQPTPQQAKQVGHAIALYRSRQSTREDKISAIRELMAVLEPDRYTVLQGTDAEKDNASLFRIANTYGIRHNKPTDRRDYNIAFLDWMFWATLAMVQLCKELKSAQARANSETP